MSLSVSVHWWFHSILYALFLSHVFVILFTNTFLSFHSSLLTYLCVHFFHKTLSSYISSITCLPVTCTLLCLPIGFTFLSPVCLCLHTFYNYWSHNSEYVYIPFTALGLPVYVCVPFTVPGLPVYVCILFTVCGLPVYVCIPFTMHGLPVYVLLPFTMCGLPVYVCIPFTILCHFVYV